MPADLARRLLNRERAAVPDALNLVDDDRPKRRRQARVLLDELERRREQLVALRIGITGAPGAGKSTLLDALVRVLRAADRSVGILAIDPSSPQTGGALLGDRFHVRSGAGDDGVYRECSGHLSTESFFKIPGDPVFDAPLKFYKEPFAGITPYRHAPRTQ